MAHYNYTMQPMAIHFAPSASNFESIDEASIDPELLEYDRGERLRRERLELEQHTHDLEEQQRIMCEQIVRDATTETGSWMHHSSSHIPDAHLAEQDEVPDMLAEVTADVHADTAQISVPSVFSEEFNDAFFIAPFLSQLSSQPVQQYHPPMQILAPETPQRPDGLACNQYLTPPSSDWRPARHLEAATFTPMRQDHSTAPSTPAPSDNISPIQEHPTLSFTMNCSASASVQSAQLPHFPTPIGSTKRPSKGTRGSSWVGPGHFEPEAAQQQPMSVAEWTQTHPNNLYQSNQLPLSAMPESSLRKTSKTASIAPSTTSFTCPSDGCGKSFEKRAQMYHHKRIHEAKTRPCQLCDAAFHFDKDLRRHMKKHTPNERDLMCIVRGCPYYTRGFQRKDHLQRHMEKLHPMLCQTMAS